MKTNKCILYALSSLEAFRLNVRGAWLYRRLARRRLKCGQFADCRKMLKNMAENIEHAKRCRQQARDWFARAFSQGGAAT